ncbi:rhodanese-like domain-containing protein [Rathayibacter sp. YIM 133350]|uniref:rhodanese-like domain-containing protein n=1 Tax=Rathayibacter sp. YIM 133350 TaxID=3131992 RepID=UPI00307CDB3F
MTNTAATVQQPEASLISPADTVAFFRAKLALETDASDVFADQQEGAPLVLVDTRSQAAWDQGHAAGAVHIPTRQIEQEVPARYAAGTRFVVYCWSPGCNGGDKAALALASLGYDVKLMIGGFEYWAREGYPVETALGTVRRDVDELVGPRSTAAAISCDC